MLPGHGRPLTPTTGGRELLALFASAFRFVCLGLMVRLSSCKKRHTQSQVRGQRELVCAAL